MSERAADVVRQRMGGTSPDIAIVLGSSVGRLADAVEPVCTIPYQDLTGFPVPSVSGHSGTLIVGRLGGREVVILKGRVHAYESGRTDVMRPVIETLAELDVKTVILTNAAGSLDENVGPGRLMLIEDHINFACANPLVGEPGDHGFVSLTNAYDSELRQTMRNAAHDIELPLAEGTYVWFSGPSFETPAEIKAARILGADAVGMSTVPETILARRYGLTVIGVSIITNLAAGMAGSAPSHEETKREGEKATDDLVRLVTRFMERTNND